jgi:hypothetical protein
MPKKTNPARSLRKRFGSNPKLSLKGARKNSHFEGRLGHPSSSRLLELADVALGLKKPEPKKKNATSAKGSSYVAPVKTEPYSS